MKNIKQYVENTSGMEVKQVGGDHYTKKGLQPWEVRLAWALDPWASDALRYILDPFAGAGTTGLVAKMHNRHSVMIELNPDYKELIEERIQDD